jgi:hypothetical protein
MSVYSNIYPMDILDLNACQYGTRFVYNILMTTRICAGLLFSTQKIPQPASQAATGCREITAYFTTNQPKPQNSSLS